MAKTILHGISVAPGIAIGKIVHTHQESHIEERFIGLDDIDSEVEKLNQAAKSVSQELEEAKQSVTSTEHGDIIQAHIMMSHDPRLLSETEECIRTQRLCAPWALQKTLDALCAAFIDLDDPYLRERAFDLRAVGTRLQGHLSGRDYTPITSSSPRVYMAEDLSPVDTINLSVDHILGLVMAEGGATSHTAILARSLHIPAIMGVTGILEAAKENDLVIVDAVAGCVYIEPDEQELATFTQKLDEYKTWADNVRRSASLPAETLDNVHIHVQANLENVNEVGEITSYGAEGIGLYRTEYAYLRSRQLPTEDQLYNEYAAVVRRAEGAQVVFRTLDVGMDKALHTQTSIKEANPALGLRGIRFCMRHQGILRTQLRAILRAALYGDVSIVLPMISCLEEVQGVKRILNEVRQDLCIQGIEHSASLPIGIMMEVPSAIMIADSLAKHCDFFSIGTNDLTHYLLAIDRSNKHVAYLHNPLHTALTRSIKRIVDCAHREGISVTVCGEIVSDPYCLAMLLGLGVDIISAAPQSIPSIKHLLRNLKAEECTKMAEAILTTADAAVCTRIVTDTLSQGLRDDFSFYTTLINTHG